MKLIIAGSRTLNPIPEFIHDAISMLNVPGQVTEIVSGKAKGVDSAGEVFAEMLGLPIKSFPANWNIYGKSAGPIRNQEMAVYADALLLIWDGKSSGSKNMKETMEKLGKPVYEVIVRGPK